MGKRAEVIVMLLLFAVGAMGLDPARAAGPESAESSGDGVGWHHRMESRVMDDMARLMSEMARSMSAPRISPADAREMSGRMRRMSQMMRLMSDWRASGAAAGPQSRERMMRMQAEMDEMMRDMMGKASSRPDAK